MSDYTYPSARDLANLTIISPDEFKEARIASNLHLDKATTPQKPRLISNEKPVQPPQPGPIEDLLAISQKLISQYKMLLPYSNSKSDVGTEIAADDKENEPLMTSANKLALNLSMTPRKNTPVSVTPARGTKRTLHFEQHEAENNNAEDIHSHSFIGSRVVSTGTPLESKSGFFSPAGKVPSLQKKLSLVSLLQSTPVKKVFTPLNKMLKTNLAVIVNTEKQPIQIYSDLKSVPMSDEETVRNEQQPAEDSDSDSDDSEDKLACHANNIMRMAVDSTMLGSTFNASLSSHYDDSVINILQQLLMLLPHDGFAFVPETEDADKSLIETMKMKWGKKGKRSLDSNRASRIEINEDDIKAAVGI